MVSKFFRAVFGRCWLFLASRTLPKQKTFTVTSLFESGLADFDNNIAFVNLNTLEEFFDLNPKDRNLEVYLNDPQNIENQKIIVQKIFPTWLSVLMMLLGIFGFVVIGVIGITDNAVLETPLWLGFTLINISLGVLTIRK